MDQDATVSAGDIARLVDVGRAAVSNWRRRHDDFPQPVGGTASSPLFSLNEVEDWLRRNGKRVDVSPVERAWQWLRGAGDDLCLGDRVAEAGAALLSEDGGTLAPLATERGPLAAFEFLCERYLEAHSRQLDATPAEVAALLVRLTRPEGGTLLDPACGLGTTLVDTPAARVLGQEIDETTASIAAHRLKLREQPGEIRTGDALRQDGFTGELADAVVCDPPFTERAWGYDELAGDARWEYGLPPRGESELAWVQHCLSHTKPGGLVAILMPSAASSRRPGRRIRANLLRAGALRAVVTLPGGPDLWLLRRPEPGDRTPSHVLLTEVDELSAVDVLWAEFRTDPSEGVPIVDVLDEDVDLSPAVQALRRSGGEDTHLAFIEALADFHATTLPTPELDKAPQLALPMTTIGELAKAGLVTIRHAGAKLTTGNGELPVLTADDLAAGVPPSERTAADPDLVDVEPGDVVASPMGTARVVDCHAVLGPYLAVYRVNPKRLDPYFLAGVLRAAASRQHQGSSRVDARRTQVPRLPLAEQEAYGRAFRQLVALEDALRETAALGESVIRLGFGGLMDGHLRPRS
jgi:hypothetical protein